jgi:flavin-dependent dehydrogenase
LNEDTSFSFIFYLKKDQVARDIMEKEYYHVIRDERSTKDFHDLEVQELKYGWYPSGGLSQQVAEDRVVFVGDAGCWTTPCGWGMTFILRNYKYFADQIGGLLQKDTLDKKSLLSVPHYKTHEKYEVLLDTVVTHFLSNASSSQLDRFIKLFQKDLKKILCEKVFCLTITQEEIGEMIKPIMENFDLRELAHIFPKEDYKLFLEEAKYFVEDFVVQEMRDLLGIFEKHKLKSRLNNGFDFS